MLHPFTAFDHHLHMPAASLFRLLFLGAIWGASFLFLRVVAPVLGAIPTAAGRLLLAAAGLFVIVLALRVPWRFKGRFRATLMLGVVNSGIPFLMYGYAGRVLPAGYAAIINATAPLMGVLIGALFFADRPTARKLWGVAAGLAGVAALTRTGPLAVTRPVLLAVLACLVATACYGLAGYLTQRWIAAHGGLDSRLVAFGSQLGGSLMLLPALLAQEAIAPLEISAVPALVWGALAALGLLCTAVAYILYFRLLADVGPLRALTVTFIVPVFGVLWGHALLDEPLGPGHALGGGLIALALWLVLQPERAAAAPRG